MPPQNTVSTYTTLPCARGTGDIRWLPVPAAPHRPAGRGEEEAEHGQTSTSTAKPFTQVKGGRASFRGELVTQRLCSYRVSEVAPHEVRPLCHACALTHRRQVLHGTSKLPLCHPAVPTQGVLSLCRLTYTQMEVRVCVTGALFNQ